MKNFNSYIPLFIPSFGSSITAVTGQGQVVVAVVIVVGVVVVGVFVVIVVVVVVVVVQWGCNGS